MLQLLGDLFGARRPLVGLGFGGARRGEGACEVVPVAGDGGDGVGGGGLEVLQRAVAGLERRDSYFQAILPGLGLRV